MVPGGNAGQEKVPSLEFSQGDLLVMWFFGGEAVENRLQRAPWSSSADFNFGVDRILAHLSIHHRSKVRYMFVPGKIYPTSSTTLFST